MKQIATLEVVKDGEVIFTSPFDNIPAGSVSSVEELKNIIKEPEASRLWFMTELKHPGCEFRIGQMNWKWDAEYYAHFDPSKSCKGTK
jgi:hypothetical protein